MIVVYCEELDALAELLLTPADEPNWYVRVSPEDAPTIHARGMWAFDWVLVGEL